MPTAKNTRDFGAEIAYLTRALKAPTLRESVDRLVERATAESWSYPEFLAACLLGGEIIERANQRLLRPSALVRSEEIDGDAEI